MNTIDARPALAYRCLIDAARKLSTAGNIEELVDHILRSSHEVMSCQACSISLPEEQSGDLLIRATQREFAPATLRVPAGRGIAGRVFRTRRPENLFDAREDLEHYLQIDRQTGIETRALLTIPILNGEECLGVMQAINPIDRDRFDSFDEEVFLAFASLIAAILNRLRTEAAVRRREIEDAYRKAEFSVARQTQVSFMPPKTWQSKLLRVQVFQEQAAAIGGDFYFYRSLADGSFLVAVGDATGKGVPAALEAARVCTLLSSLASGCEPDRFGTWIAELNNILCETASQSNSLTTLAALLIDLRRRRISTVCCGQTQPCYQTNSGEWRQIPGEPLPPLGLNLVETLSVCVLPFGLGRRWLLATDGILEAVGPTGKAFGINGLIRSLNGCDNCPLTALERDWRQHCGLDSQQDDATILLLEDLLPSPQQCYEGQLSPESIPDFRSFFERWALWAGLSEEVTYQVVLAGDELLTNIYRHAYRERPGPIACVARITPFALELTLRHQGDPHQPAIEGSPRPEESAGGRGLPYIRSVFDRVEFVTLNQGGEIQLVRALTE